MRTNPREFSRKLDWAIVLLFFVFAYSFYRNFDPVEMLSGDIHIWDSWHYKSLSNQMLSNGFNGLSEFRPYCYRILQPALASIARIISGATFSEASHVVNILSTFFVSLFCFHLWRRLDIPKAYAFAGIFTMNLSWQGPLRYSIFYPGGQFAFEIAMTCLAFLALRWIYCAKNIIDFPLPAICLFIATLGRDNTLYQVTIVALFLFLRQEGKSKNNQSFMHLAAIIPSLVGYFAVRVLVEGEGSFNILSHVMEFGWFHLNIAEDLYMFFFAYGTIFLFFLICITFPSPRQKLINIINNNSIDINLIAGFCIASTIFALVGGTDSNRFLLWSLPFFYFIGLKSLNILVNYVQFRRHAITMLSGAVILTLLWTRFYVPAIPHLFFPNDNYNSQAGVKTNLNPSLYKGIPLLLNLREDLIEIPKSEAYASERIGDKSALPKVYISQKLQDINSEKYTLANRKKWTNTPFKFSYRFYANNIPFPLGFAHNQNELLAIHPYQGNNKLKLLLLIQWIIIYLSSAFWVYRKVFNYRSS